MNPNAAHTTEETVEITVVPASCGTLGLKG